MITTQTDHLFCAGDAHAVQEHRRKQMREEIAAIDGNRLLNTNVEDLTAYFAQKYALEIPEIHTDRMIADHREAQRDLSGHGDRAFTRGSRMVTGTEIIVEVPFT